MSLDNLTEDVEETYESLDEDLALDLDDDTRRELTMLMAAMDKEDPQDLIEEAVRLLFQSTVETGKLDFHLRSAYDVTYDEYLSGMTFDEMTADAGLSQQSQDDVRRYQY